MSAQILRYKKCVSPGALIVYCVTIVLLSIEWVVFRLEVLDDHPSAIATFVKGMIEMSVVLLPFFYIKPKWRWMVVWPVIILSIFYLANALYFRVFGKLIPIESMLFFKNFDSTLFNSVTALYCKRDLVYAVVPFVEAGAVIWANKAYGPGAKFTRRTKAIATVSSLAMYAAVMSIGIYRGYAERHRMGIGISLSEHIKDRHLGLTATKINVQHDTGLLHYLAISVVREICKESKIDKYTDAQLAEITAFLQANADLRAPSPEAFAQNKDKNLILIIVESLNSEVIGKSVNGAQVTPTLNRLAASEGAIFASSVVSQVGDGWSSDGQMLYNTGLLPLKMGAAAMTCERNEYVSLAQLLGKRRSVEFICEAPHFWNHAATSVQYQYDHMYSADDIDRSDTRGADQAVLEFAAATLPELPEPFFAEITTLSSHLPFDNVGTYSNDTILSASGISPLRLKYYNSINYFDRQLGVFIHSLAESGLLDRCVIAIIGDHNIEFGKYDNYSEPDDPCVPFIAVNAGMTAKVDKTIGQCDIFPTILDIMAVEPVGEWCGVGLSALNEKVGGAIGKNGTVYGPCDTLRLQQAYRVSDLLLRGYGTKSLPQCK